MPIDPRDYDVDELRETAGELSLEEVAAAATGPSARRIELGERTPDPPPDSGRPDAGPDASPDASPDALRRELAILERATGGPLERPYLRRLPDSYDAERTAMEWVDQLVRSVGLDGTRSALRYYRSVGWIGREVEGTLMDHAAGLSEGHVETGSGLDWSDHRAALAYVARLATMAAGEAASDDATADGAT